MAKKIGMSDFRKSREDKSKQSDAGEEVHEVQTVTPARPERKESLSASPMLGASKTAGAIKKTERKTMRLPISGRDIELTATDTVPSDCLIHPRNQRVQSLLKLSNPKVARLKESFEREKQRDPVLARWVTQDDGTRAIEILDGSRRRFVCDAIYQADSKTLLKAWVGQIPDVDADYLAKAGNDDRDDISPWELSQYLKKIEQEHPTWSHEVIAANEKMSRTNVTNLISIADIPLEVVALLESPDLLKVNSGLQVAKLLRGALDDHYIKILEKEAPFTKFSDLANRLKELLKPRAPVDKPAANRKIEIKNGNKVRAAIGANRKVKGQYKIDLFDLSDAEYEEVFAFLEKALK